jgi:hypothetical protein
LQIHLEDKWWFLGEDPGFSENDKVQKEQHSEVNLDANAGPQPRVKLGLRVGRELEDNLEPHHHQHAERVHDGINDYLGVRQQEVLDLDLPLGVELLAA